MSIRLGGARPPRGLRSQQVIDLSDWPARGADRAMNTLLGSVDAVANGTAQRAADDDGSKLWIALAVCAVLVGGGYALFRPTEAPAGVANHESRGEALALDPQGPHARAVLAALRGLMDLQWADAQRYAKGLDVGSSDPELARIVGPLHALFGEADGQSASPAADRGTEPLCGIAADAAFARAVVDLDGARRLVLLGSRCIVERIQRSPAVRAQLGIVPG